MIENINDTIIKRKIDTGLSYIEIICELIEEKNLDYETLKKHLSKAIVEKVEAEFSVRRMFKLNKDDLTLDNLF